MFCIDIFEPDLIKHMLGQVIPDLIVASINSLGSYPDYYWTDVQGNGRGWERKQVGEALSDLDAVEEQLNRELSRCDELTLVVENPWLPLPDGIQTYMLTRDKGFFRPDYAFVRQPGLVARYEGFKDSLRKAGIAVIETSHMEVTAHAIAAAYRGSNKEHRTTLRRYLNPHIAPFSPNLHIENLMRLKGMNIGEKRAKQAIERYGTFWAVVSKDYKLLAHLWGKTVAKHFMETIGRGDEV